MESLAAILIASFTLSLDRSKDIILRRSVTILESFVVSDCWAMRTDLIVAFLSYLDMAQVDFVK